MMQLLQGDCLTMLATLPAQSVQTVITSPPAGVQATPVAMLVSSCSSARLRL